jgi:hypothetical protein
MKPQIAIVALFSHDPSFQMYFLTVKNNIEVFIYIPSPKEGTFLKVSIHSLKLFLK